MKRIFLFILIAGTLLTSCTDMLDLNPSDFLSPNNYYKDSTQIDKALVGVYAANINLTQTYYLPYFFNVSDEMYYSSTSGISYTNYNGNSADNNSKIIWGNLYTAIEISNMFIEKVSNVTIDSVKKNEYLGQAKFLRAYAYFLLVSNFGDVPLKTKATTSASDVFYERTPAKEVYDFIVNEMEESESMVKERTAYNTPGRITKPVVEGILARVCLFRAGFPNCTDINVNAENRPWYEKSLYWSEKVVNSGSFQLNPSYSQIFINLIQDKYDMKESIWEGEFYYTGPTDVYVRSTSIGAIDGIKQTNKAYGYCSSGFRPQAASVFNKYDSIDTRRDWNIAPYCFEGDNTQFKVYRFKTELYERYMGKYRREYQTNGINGNLDGLNVSTNIPLLRYSDVLLMAAEAENELNGPTSKAVGYVEQVRKRAYGALMGGQRLSKIVILTPGSNYTVPVPGKRPSLIATNPIVTISGGGIDSTKQAHAVATVSTLAATKGQILSIDIIDNGGNYTSAPKVTVSTPTGGTAATAIATLVTADYSVPIASISDLVTFRKFIQDERSRELCFEGNRRLDLRRWGILISRMKEVAEYVLINAPTSFRKMASDAALNITDKFLFLPIPQSEIMLDPKLTQNPSY